MCISVDELWVQTSDSRVLAKRLRIVALTD